MCRTTNGFEIAEADMQLRGAGNIDGTQQSGAAALRLADLSKDGEILRTARVVATEILEADLYLQNPENLPLLTHIANENAQKRGGWGRIS